jgi:hypothetical protein
VHSTPRRCAVWLRFGKMTKGRHAGLDPASSDF